MGRIAAIPKCLALLAAAAIGAESGAAEEPPLLVIEDFEAAGMDTRIEAGNGSVQREEGPAPAGGQVLRWSLQPAESCWLYIGVPKPPDLGRLRCLRFRARLEGARPGALWVRLENEEGAWLGGRARGIGEEWRQFELDLDRMERDGTFDPAAVVRVGFLVWGSRGGTYLIDDVALAEKPAAAPPPAAGGKPPAAGSKAPRRAAVADFEGSGSEDFADAWPPEVARVAAGGKEKGHVLAWTLRAAEKVSYLQVYGAPRDVREHRVLRFRVRADRPFAPELHVRVESGIQDVIYSVVQGIGPAWKSVELLLPEMRPLGAFDPRRVEDVSFTFFEGADGVIQLDDLEFETGPGGWQFTEPEMVARIFGEDRARKVKKIATKHFDIYTDSAAAQGKFPKGLEAIYDFVVKTLGTPEMEEKLPVYIFQNPTLYVDFCVRHCGWTKEAADLTAGHGSGLYFATYYQAPEAPVVAHELTHSIFHRTMGAQGGSWFQEGVAVHVEHAWQKRSAAEAFAPSLRSGQFVPLAEFMALETLAFTKDAKGGPRTPERLYLQAGAFHEFLVRGPLSGPGKEAILQLSRTPKRTGEQPAYAARLLGRSLEALEKEWIAWGGNPPKGK
jgi:hypothetical protein